jgi:hypothetical protein
MDDNHLWANEEFGDVDLGDGRLNARLRALACDTVAAPCGLLTKTVKTRARREAAFRLVENHRVLPDAIAASTTRATCRRLAGSPTVFVAVDQSSLAFKDPHRVKGLGPTGPLRNKGSLRGLEVMSSLAVSADGQVQGLLGQQWWVRSDERTPGGKNDKRDAPHRESAAWVRSMHEVSASMHAHCPGVRPCFVMDRGGDFYGVFNAAQHLGNVDVIVRSAYNRRLTDDRYLHNVVHKAPVVARVARLIRVKSDNGRCRQRLVPLEVRVAHVELRLRFNEKNRGTARLTVVQVRSRRRKQPISWTLLTTCKVKSAADALGIVDGYCLRWRIEDFHRSWKRGGCDVERSQLGSVDALKRWATILAAVAARIERLKTESRTSPNRPAREEFDEEELRTLLLITGERKPPAGMDMTLDEAVFLVACLGGYGGRSAGPPGSVILGRGMERLLYAVEVCRLVKRSG